MAERLNLTYAMKDGKLIHISEAERGLKCGCICPACRELVIARKGTKKMHHFAHRSSENCQYGYETSLHLAAKEILSQAKKIVIPSIDIIFYGSFKDMIRFSDATEITIERVELEHKFRNVIPDVVVYTDGKPLFIEIYVTHPVDEEKLNKLKELGISTIEIDLSGVDHSITTEELSDILLKNNPLKYWKYNAISDRYLQKFYEVADKRYIDWKHGFPYVNDCPVRSGNETGDRRADEMDDCPMCKYCIAKFQDYILCTGRQDISSVDDLDRADIKHGKEFKVIEPVIKSQPQGNSLNGIIPLEKPAQIKNTPHGFLPDNCIPADKPVQITREKDIDSVVDKEFYSSEPWISLFRQMDDKRRVIRPLDEQATVNGPALNATVSVVKNILAKADMIILPPVYLHCDEKNVMLKDAQKISVRHMELDYHAGRNSFDAVIHNDGKPVAVKFFLSDHMDEEHIEIARALHMAVLEINLRQADRYVTIKKFAYDLLNSSKHKHWLCHPDADKY